MDYKTIATLNESHHIYLVQEQNTQKIYVQKILFVYNRSIYEFLKKRPIIGIPQIHEICQLDEQLVIIEDYIGGTSLQEKIDAADLTPYAISQYIFELCTILQQLHSLQPPIVHRDIKPSNLILCPDGHIVLLDFNAAKYYTENATKDTVLLGTQGYAAPEQYGFGSSTPQTDIYSIGVLLRELTDSLPIPCALFEEVIRKCLQLNPADRFASVTELQQHLPLLPVPTTLLPSADNSKTNNCRMSTSDATPSKDQSLHRFALPGFRTRKPLHMLLATFIYLFLLWLCLTLEVKNTYGAALWIERIFCLLIFLSNIFGCTNYLQIQKLLPLCQHPNRLVRYCGIVLLDILLGSILMVVMFLIELLLFS